MPRMTKTFSYDTTQNKWFKMVKKEAKNRRPIISDSQMMVEIIRDYFEKKEMIDAINRSSLEKIDKGA